MTNDVYLVIFVAITIIFILANKVSPVKGNSSTGVTFAIIGTSVLFLGFCYIVDMVLRFLGAIV